MLVAVATGCLPVYGLSPTFTLSQYIHTSWGSDFDLQAVRRLAQTPDGYLWLATRAGLVRFDGSRFKTFKAGADKGLESSTTQDLLVDTDGSLWIASLGGGISHYQDGAFTSYTSHDGLQSNEIQTLYRDSHGVMWIGTRGRGIMRKVRDRFEPGPRAMSSSSVTSFLEDDHSLWIATTAGVYRLQNGTLRSFSTSDGLPDPRVNCLCRDHSGRIWTGGWKGISYWNGTRFVGHPAVNAAMSSAIACREDRAGNFWVASSSGLYRVQGANVTKMDSSSGLSGDYASDVLEDREANLWVATRGGLDRLRDGQIRTFTRHEGLASQPGPLLADEKGGVWSVLSRHVARVAENVVKTWPLTLPSGSTPFTVLAEADSDFLIGFDKGVMHWKSERSEIVRELAGLNVHCLFKAHNGTIWIATSNRGLLRWQLSSHGKRTLRETGVPDTFVQSLGEDHSGNILAGTVHGDLYRIAGDTIEHFGPDAGFRSAVYTIFVDSKGDPWFGSIGGVSWFQNGRIQTVGSREGLPADQAFEILDDSYGRLWLLTFAGIVEIEKEHLFEWAAGRRRRIDPVTYKYNAGLEIIGQFRFFQDAVRSADGHLWFSLPNGLIEVTPPRPGTHGLAYPVLVEDVTIDRVPYPNPKAIRIPPGARSVEILYTALTLSTPEALRFRYRLEGNDKDWVDADTRRVAFYNNLKPGTYTFRVSARAGEEHWQESSILTVEQLPFFWQTQWFLLLSVSLS